MSNEEAVRAVPNPEIDDVAKAVRVALRAYHRSSNASIDARFVLGRCLLRARELHPSNREFGRWCTDQGLTYSRQWRSRLMRAAEHEAAVRAELSSQLDNGRPADFDKALAIVLEALKRREPTEIPSPPAGTFRCILADPPWEYYDTPTRGAASRHYPTMTLEEIKAVPVPAAPDAHLWLCVTNAHLPDAFDVVHAWGFEYKTLLTWVKTNGMGTGNWLRNNTEHVLFCVRGKLPPLRRDCPTVFEAPRTRRHSEKPIALFQLVESVTPGPRVELFAREERPGWAGWGLELRTAS
jgi:N6-adenosine-specific RNA methylase IME4